MAERWHRTAALVGLPGMPGGRSIRLHGTRRGWVSREVSLGRRTVLEWLESSLPAETQAALSGDPQVDCPPAATVAGAGARPSSSRVDPSPAAFFDESGDAALADARLDIIAAFRRFRSGPFISELRRFADVYVADPVSTGVSDDTRNLLPSFGWSTLRRWIYAHSDAGVTALLPQSAGRTSAIDADPALAEFIAAMLLSRPHHVTAKHIRRAVKAKHGVSLHIAQIQRWVRRWRRLNSRMVSAVADPDGHRSHRMPAFGDAAAEVTELNQIWELDSSPADVICADGRRCRIICAIDVWSRRAQVLVAPESCSAAIAALVRRCLLHWGVPRMVVSDEGADYTSRHIRWMHDRLDVAHDILPPYSPDRKPFVERFIGTISRDLFRQLPGFSGHSVADRKRLRDRKSFAQRRGETDTEAFNCTLSAEGLQEHIDGWCANIYGREVHSGLGGLSPFERAASWTGELRTITDERALDFLMAKPAGGGTRTVGKDGIRVNNVHYVAPELGPRTKQRVHVLEDPASPERIAVFGHEETPDVAAWDFICVAWDRSRLGPELRRVAAEARARARAQDSADRKLARDLLKIHRPAGAIDLVQERAAAGASKVAALPRRGTGHTSDGIEAARRAARASEQASRRDRDDREVRDDDEDLLMKFYKGSY